MRLNQLNCMEFADWDNARPITKRLKEAIRRLNKIAEEYEETGLPSRHATLDDFAYRVFLLYYYTEKKHISEIAARLQHDGDWVRYKVIFPDLQVYKGSDVLQPCVDRFEENLKELKKLLVNELDEEIEKAKGETKNVRSRKLC